MEKGTVKKGYLFEEKLGVGGGGEVWKVKKGEMIYAIKIIQKFDGSINYEEEFAKNIRLKEDFPFLVKFNETFSEKETSRFFIVMEFCRDGDLSSLISFAKKMNFKLDTMRVMKIFIQLVLGLHELHTNNILHRDVKPENVFVNEVDSVKLGDFGCFKVISDTIKAKTYIGTPQYMAPEIHLGSEYGTASDIWSLGVVLYQLCTLTRPFDGPNNFMILKKIVEEPLAPIPAGIYPLDLVKALEGMLDKTEKNSPSTLMLLQMPLMVEFAKRFDIYKYFPSERVASPTLPASKAKSMGIVPSTIPASPMIYLFRVKCKNFMFGHEYGYGKEEKDVAGICNYGDNIEVYMSESDNKTKSIKKENVMEFEFETYSGTAIDDKFLCGCTSLTTPPTIPNSVTSIGRYFLYNCTSLTTPLTIPRSVTIGNGFLLGCKQLKKQR